MNNQKNYGQNCKWCNKSLILVSAFCNRDCKVSYEHWTDERLYQIDIDLRDWEFKSRWDFWVVNFHKFTNGQTMPNLEESLNAPIPTPPTCDFCPNRATRVENKNRFCDFCYKLSQVTTLREKSRVELIVETAVAGESNSAIANPELARKIEQNHGVNIAFKQDLANFAISSIEALRQSCENEAEFITKLTERYEKLADVIHKSNTEQLMIAQTLRDKGALARQEIRDSLRASDDKYIPEVKKIPKSSIKSEKKSPFERMVETVAMNKGLTIEQARAKILANPVLMQSLTEGQRD